MSHCTCTRFNTTPLTMNHAGLATLYILDVFTYNVHVLVCMHVEIITSHQYVFTWDLACMITHIYIHVHVFVHVILLLYNVSYDAWADQRFRRYYIMHIIPHCMLQVWYMYITPGWILQHPFYILCIVERLTCTCIWAWKKWSMNDQERTR